MAGTVPFKLKRSLITGTVPLTTDLAIGELGINIPDRKIFSSNGSVVFELGANTTDSRVANTLIINKLSSNGSVGSNGQVLTSNGTGTYWQTLSTGVGAVSNIRNIVGTNITTIQTAIDYVDATSVFSVEYFISAIDNTNGNKKTAKLLIAANSTASIVSEFGTILTNPAANVVSFETDVNAGSIRLLATGDSSNISVFARRTILGSSTTAGDIAGTMGAQTAPGGANTYVQINDQGAFYGSSTLTFNKTTSTLSVANLTVSAITANGSMGSAGQVMSSNGTALYWSSVTASPGGPNTSIQINDSGVMTGNASLTFDKTAVKLSIGNSTVNTTANSTSVNIGANVVLTVSGLTIGNSTVNTALTSTGLTKNGISYALSLSPTFTTSIILEGNATSYSTINITNTYAQWIGSGGQAATSYTDFDVHYFRTANTTTNKAIMYANGNLLVAADITAYSDISLKENIVEITPSDAAEKVMNLRGVYFNSKKDGSRQIGLIAQETIEVIPEIVHEDDDGILSIAYQKSVAMLIQAFKDQQSQIKELREQISAK